MNPLITSYSISVTPLATSKQILFEDLWQRLDQAPLLNGAATTGKSQAARDVQRICKLGHAEALADKVERKVIGLIDKLISKLLEMSVEESRPEEEFLVEFFNVWVKLCSQLQTYRDVFYSLERGHFIRERHGQTLWQLALSTMEIKISDRCKFKLCSGVQKLIHQDRLTSGHQREFISKLIHVSLALNFYNLFEAGYLSDTREFYRSAANEAFKQNNVSVHSRPLSILLAVVVFDFRRKAVCEGGRTQYRLPRCVYTGQGDRDPQSVPYLAALDLPPGRRQTTRIQSIYRVAEGGRPAEVRCSRPSSGVGLH